MQLKTITVAAALSGSVLGRSLPTTLETLKARDVSASADDVLLDIQALASQTLQLAFKPSTTCSLSTIQYRKDWADLSTGERKNYISALQCLLNKPSQADPAVFPGARNRYDDFVAVHMNQTLTIHGTANFLTWHRYFTWAYEQALRNECGYEGYAPYWNWFTHADNMTASPVFDGSDTSLSGDGAYVAHNGSNPVGDIYLPSGNGGGCVMSGPLVNMTVNLGPWYPTMDGMTNDPNGEFGYNPQCLSRDLSNYVSSEYFTTANLMNLTVGYASTNISTFQVEFWGRFTDGFLGMHTTGHVSVGADASSLYSSITDPTFFLHHGMVDRMYWMWQMLHPEEAGKIAATITSLNSPASRDGLLTDTVYLGNNLAPDSTIGDLISTTAGPFCYAYL